MEKKKEAVGQSPMQVSVSSNNEQTNGDSLPAWDKRRWTFSPSEMENTPSHKCGMKDEDEKACRRRAARFIRTLGLGLKLPNLPINTAKIFMHRFYMHHSFSVFDYFEVGVTCLFVAAKTEGVQTRSVNDVVVEVKKLNIPSFQGLKNEEIKEKILDAEPIVLQTMGFDLNVDVPHTHFIKQCKKFGAPSELVELCILMANNSLILTRMCLRYSPTVVACVCILGAAKIAKWDIPGSKEGKDWCTEVDPEVNLHKIIHLVDWFIKTCQPPTIIKS